MFLRSLWNPNAFKFTVNHVLGTYFLIFFFIIVWVTTIFIIKSLYKLFKKIKKNEKKENLKEVFFSEKNVFKVLKYPTIWAILVWTSWLQVSLCFWLFNILYKISISDITKEERLPEEWRVFWCSASYTLWFFLIGWCLIWLSFWNKMLRNLWILFYVLWIFFIIFVLFLDYWYISDWLGNLNI